MNIGDKVYVHTDKYPFIVQAINSRFAVLTKPFNLKSTVLYTVIDFEKNIRGTENTVFCMGYESQEDCDEALKRFTSGESEVSRRNFVPLDIVKIITQTNVSQG